LIVYHISSGKGVIERLLASTSTGRELIFLIS
jgi:hypothetical protein